MGRIKTTLVNRRTHELLDLYGEHFTTDFTQNKELMKKYANIPSKKMRNIIAGYMTRLKKKSQ